MGTENRLWQLAVFLGIGTSLAVFGSNKVGNGDDGTDLEGVTPLTQGAVFEAREKAVKLLGKLNIAGIPGLGTLVPEVAHADLFLAQRDITASLPSDQGTFHSSFNGLVYARTFPQAHAATRFFPIATELSQGQLIALHIHEALHRALPPTVREDEQVVAGITLAITSPDGSHDRVREAVGRSVSPTDLEMAAMSGSPHPARDGSGAMIAYVEAEEEHFKQPSSVGYTFRQFWKASESASFPITRMHIVESNLYPFGGPGFPIGFGIQATVIDSAAGNQTGPLGISANMRVWSRRGFNVGISAKAALNVLSTDELKNSPFGRDVYTLGVSMRKDLETFYVENFVSFDFDGQANQTIGAVTYHYNYGAVVEAKVRAGVRVGKFDVGGFGELFLLVSSFKVDGGAFSEDLGRFRILSAGPEVTYSIDNFALSLQARYLIDSTKGASFDYLGNLMGPGVSQGSIGLTGRFFF